MMNHIKAFLTLTIVLTANLYAIPPMLNEAHNNAVEQIGDIEISNELKTKLSPSLKDNFPIIHYETTILDFPKPIDIDKADRQQLADYYWSIESAYFEASEKLNQSYERSQESLTKTNKKLHMEYLKNKPYSNLSVMRHEKDDYRRNVANCNKDKRDTRVEAEKLSLMTEFYATVAALLEVGGSAKE